VKSLFSSICSLLLLVVIAQGARAELTIQITQGMDNPTRIALVPFGWREASPVPGDIAQIVSADLQRSGLFVALDKNSMLSLPTSGTEVYYRDWRILNQEYLLIGNVTPTTDGRYRVQYELYDVLKEQRVMGEVIQGQRQEFRDIAHTISDKIYETLTGIAGSFSTRIAYVTFKRLSTGQDQYRLEVADADGYRAQTILESNEPILSPDWSNDGQRIAYVSFEANSRPSIYVQHLTTGARERIPSYTGLNSAPNFSPDGKKLALVLSRDGNPEIYQYEFANQKFTRLTNHFGIDTEPSWTPDGRSIMFTSDRGGKPQIYRLNVASGNTERVTYQGDYNARPRLSDDGRYLVHVHRQNSVFHVAVLDLEKDDLRILTQTQLDESPSIAPNGSMVIYATNYQNKGILAAVSVDGRVKFNLPSSEGDVREPAWSP